MTVSPNPPLVAVGAAGGSGTRVMAQLLISAGIFLGRDLNPPRDNLLSVLLFNRRSVLTDSDADFRALLDLFYRRMSGPFQASPDEVALVRALAAQERMQHAPAFLQDRLAQFLEPDPEAERAGIWGWKMPPTHVFLHRLLAADPTLRYIHIQRNGLDMAFSDNQNQLSTWGPVFLDRPVEITPRESLSYWCAMQDRLSRLAAQHPGRILQLRFEDICARPADSAREVFAFLGHPVRETVIEEFAAFVRPPETVGRYRDKDLGQFRPADLERLRAAGYSPEG